MINKLTALDLLLGYSFTGTNLTNPFEVIGLYPSVPLLFNNLPFSIPNPTLLSNLPYHFNTIPNMIQDTCYSQLINPDSHWHILVDNCVIEDLILPINSTETKVITGFIRLHTIELQPSLSLENYQYNLLITSNTENGLKRITHQFNLSMLQPIYINISKAVARSYMRVINDILEGQSNNILTIKNFTINKSNNTLFINANSYPEDYLPIISWIMYTLFN
jgi:hypothetical protein